MRDGLVFLWKAGPPGPYKEKNNKSALDHLPQLRDTVATWEKAGFVERLSEPALCCNPMTVAVQYNLAANSVKYRPCIDLSRHVNLHISDMGVKLDDLYVSEGLIAPGDFMTALDLENMYLHIRLRPDMKKYLGFAVPQEDGSTVFFQFRVMPFGVKPAVAVVTRLLKPVKAYFHRLGIKFSIYIDDGRVSAASSEVCARHMAFVLDILQRVGWHIQWKKTVVQPTQSLLYQGFVTDSVAMAYFLPQEKWEKIAAGIRDLLAAAAVGPVEVRVVAVVLGRLAAIRRSHGNVVRILSRSLQHQLGGHVQEAGWTGVLSLSAAAVQELRLLLEVLPEFNGHFIPTQAAASSVLDLREVLDSVHHIQSSGSSLPNLLVSDASDQFAFIFQADGTFRYVADFPVDPAASSTSRELDALLNAVIRDASNFAASGMRIIYWQTDSQVAARILQIGSRVPELQRKIFLIKSVERMAGFTVIPVWSPRDHIRLRQADAGSRLRFSSDEWSVDRRDLAAVFADLAFLPDCDGFATAANTVAPVFYAVCPQVGCAGVDFFAQCLAPGIRYFLCPPVKLIPRLLAFLAVRPGLTVLLVVPDWPSASFWAVLHPGGFPHPMVRFCRRFSPRFFSVYPVHSLFTSGARIPMLAMLCHT